MTEPTDRSTPRTSSTKVMPIAMTATCVDWVRMLRKLASDRKRSDSSAEDDEQDREQHQRREPQQRAGRECGRPAGSRRLPQSHSAARISASRSKLRAVEEAADLAAAHDHDAVGHADQLLDLGRDEQDRRRRRRPAG